MMKKEGKKCPNPLLSMVSAESINGMFGAHVGGQLVTKPVYKYMYDGLNYGDQRNIKKQTGEGSGQ